MDGVEIVAATPDRFDDVAEIFTDCADGRRCWCAFWFLPNAQFKAGWGESNRFVLEDMIRSGREPGLVAYVGGEPAGWMLVAPRDGMDRLKRSKALAPVDGRAVWAMNCFIVKRKFRRNGLTRRLIGAGVDFVRARGGGVIEAYPVESNNRVLYDLFLGSAAAFREHGFREVARRLPRRPILRLEV